MNIVVNGEDKGIVSLNLKQAIKELGYEKLICATALNGQFVSVQDRNETILKEGDKIEILTPQQGG